MAPCTQLHRRGFIDHAMGVSGLTPLGGASQSDLRVTFARRFWHDVDLTRAQPAGAKNSCSRGGWNAPSTTTATWHI